MWLRKITLLFWLVATCLCNYSQVSVSGFVKDKTTGEALVGSHIVEQGTNHATLADNNGYFSIILPAAASLEFVYVGYNRMIVQIESKTDTLITVQLDSDILLEEVVIKAPKSDHSNISTLSGRELSYLPAIGSRPDVMKSIQLMPGIQSQNEGSSLLLVRGGDPGQNLYLIDNIPLIY